VHRLASWGSQTSGHAGPYPSGVDSALPVRCRFASERPAYILFSSPGTTRDPQVSWLPHTQQPRRASHRGSRQLRLIDSVVTVSPGQENFFVCSAAFYLAPECEHCPAGTKPPRPSKVSAIYTQTASGIQLGRSKWPARNLRFLFSHVLTTS
jgi:hypothetical protein